MKRSDIEQRLKDEAAGIRQGKVSFDSVMPTPKEEDEPRLDFSDVAFTKPQLLAFYRRLQELYPGNPTYAGPIPTRMRSIVESALNRQADISDEMSKLEKEKGKLSEALKALLVSAGYETELRASYLDIDITRYQSVRESFDMHLLLAAGVTPMQLKAGTKYTPIDNLRVSRTKAKVRR